MVPDDLVVPAESHVAPLSAMHAASVAPGIAVNSAEHRWFTSMPAVAPEAQAEWLRFPEQTLPAGSLIHVSGAVRQGGIRIATTQSNQRIDSRAITSPGPFRVLIAVPEAGPFAVRINDEGRAEWRRQPKSLLRAGIALVAPAMLADDFELTDVSWISGGR